MRAVWLSQQILPKGLVRQAEEVLYCLGEEMKCYKSEQFPKAKVGACHLGMVLEKEPSDQGTMGLQVVDKPTGVACLRAEGKGSAPQTFNRKLIKLSILQPIACY